MRTYVSVRVFLLNIFLGIFQHVKKKFKCHRHKTPHKIWKYPPTKQWSPMWPHPSLSKESTGSVLVWGLFAVNNVGLCETQVWGWQQESCHNQYSKEQKLPLPKTATVERKLMYLWEGKATNLLAAGRPPEGFSYMLDSDLVSAEHDFASLYLLLSPSTPCLFYHSPFYLLNCKEVPLNG